MAYSPREVRYKDFYLQRALAGEEFLLFDGGMGTMLQQAGLSGVANPPDLLNLSHPSEIEAIQRAYVEAGSDVISTNTFNANPAKLEGRATVEEVYEAAVRIAKAAGARYVAGDIGPTGALLEPLGTLSFDEAYEQFAEQARAAEGAGCDLILIETMADLREAKAAVLAALENTSLPVCVSMSFEADGRTFLGTTPEIAATTLSSLGVQAVGVNCSVGPDEMLETVKQIRRRARCAVLAQPNAGLPKMVDGQTVYEMDVAQFATSVKAMIEAGATLVGGCCGTNPTYIKALREVIDGLRAPGLVVPGVGQAAGSLSAEGRAAEGQPAADRVAEGQAADDWSAEGWSGVGQLAGEAAAHQSGTGRSAVSQAAGGQTAEGRCVASQSPACQSQEFVVCSAQELVVLREGESAVKVIGERINPTGKKRLKAALKAGEIDYVVTEAIAQTEAGADILDVNVGLPEIDEPTLLAQCVEELQACVTTPLQIDSADPAAIERAVRSYAGRPLINSVNGKQQNLDEILPIVAHYGCSVVGLTLDEDGIPSTAEGRLAIARRIVEAAEAYGIPRCDVVIDCLTMAVATNQSEAREILRAIKLVKEQLGVRTVLGVSNISFGLPQRSLMNAVFLAAAFGAGLDMAIMDPLNRRAMDTVHAYCVVCGQDESARDYIELYATATDPYVTGPVVSSNPPVVPDGTAAVVCDPRPGAPMPLGAKPCPIPIPAGAEAAAAQVAQVANLVLSGRKAPMADAVADLLGACDPMTIINGVFVPLLDLVGQKYESGEFFLPQLMSSAEAVKAGFDVIRERQELEVAEEPNEDRGGDGSAMPKLGPILLATVEGDIHDIGKNIVRMLMENYGIEVIDLGRDVAPQTVLEAVKANDVSLVGLSALMTTTVRAMERTITLLKQEAPGVSVLVGGAVLTSDYAQTIGADFYAKDAAESAQLATRFFRERQE